MALGNDSSRKANMTRATKRALKQILTTQIIVEPQPLQSTASLEGKYFHQSLAVSVKGKNSKPSQAHVIVEKQVTLP